MPKTKTDTDAQARAQIAALGLNPDAPAFGVTEVEPTKAKAKAKGPVLSPVGVDPHMMPVGDIVFDPTLLDDFADLKGELKAASDHVFAQYRTLGRKDPDRHGLLHRRIGDFIRQTRRTRETGTQHVKEEVRRTGRQRDLLALLAEHGITSVEDLQASLGGGA